MKAAAHSMPMVRKKSPDMDDLVFVEGEDGSRRPWATRDGVERAAREGMPQRPAGFGAA